MLNKKIKICLVTWYGSNNYGTNLQIYALYKFLEKLGYDVDVITPFSWIKRYHQYPYQDVTIGYIIHKFVKKIFHYRESIRQDKIMKFLLRNFTFSRRVKYREDVDAFCYNYDYFLTGSDQIWNPYNLDLFYMLDFVSDNAKKVAYSSSIALNSIPINLEPIYVKYLSLFKKLSCREKTGANLLSELLKKEIKTVLDPVLLLDTKSWLNFSHESVYSYKNIIKKPYIFCYFIGDKQRYWDDVNNILKENGCNKAVIFSVFKLKSKLPPCIYLLDGDISDFVYLLANADLVCTDSFHCMAMSIKLKKKFISFIRCASDVKSENSRVYDLLKHFNLSDQIYNGSKEQIHKEIDYSNVAQILKNDIKECTCFLENNLS